MGSGVVINYFMGAFIFILRGASINKIKFSFIYIIALLVMGHSYFRLFTGGFHNFFLDITK